MSVGCCDISIPAWSIAFWAIVLSDDKAAWESAWTGEVVELNDEGVVDTQLTTLSELFTFTKVVETLVVW